MKSGACFLHATWHHRTTTMHILAYAADPESVSCATHDTVVDHVSAPKQRACSRCPGLCGASFAALRAGKAHMHVQVCVCACMYRHVWMDRQTGIERERERHTDRKQKRKRNRNRQ